MKNSEFDLGYLIGVHRHTHKFEVLSTRVHYAAAESFVKTEIKLNKVEYGGLHADYYNLFFVKETDMEECRSLIYRVNELKDESTVFGFMFIANIIG